MNARLYLLLAFLFGAILSRALAGEVTDGSGVVGVVLGQEITAADIELKEPIDITVKFDASDEARWTLMTRISQKLGTPIVERFVKEQKVEATAEEIAKFKANSKKQNALQLRTAEKELADVIEQLSENSLSKEDREALAAKKALYQNVLESMRKAAEHDVPDDIARSFIVAWKTEKALHREFGGRVIFQQFGPEALDGRRRLFEKAEKDGDLKFKDDGVRHMFYYYSNMKHIEVDEETFNKQPWFLAD